MSSEPPPIAALQPAHPLLDHVLRRCLEKDPERRWQSIGDVTGELRWMADHPIAPPSPRPAPRAEPVERVAMAAGHRPRVGRRAPAGRRACAHRAARRSLRAPLRDLARRRPTIRRWRCRRTAANRLRREPESRSRCSGSARSTPSRTARWRARGRQLSVLVAGRPHIGFFADDKLKRIDVAGGTPLVIADAPNARGGAWNADGVILFAPGVTAPIMRVSARGGPTESVTQVEHRQRPAHRLPQFLPDGKRFLFSSTLGTADTNGIYMARSTRRRRCACCRRRRGRPLRRARQAADDQAGSAAGVQLQSGVRHRAGRTGGHRQGFAGAAATACSRPPTTACSRIAPAPPSAGSWCGSIGREPCCARLASRRPIHRVAGAEPRREVGGRVPSAHRRQRHLGDRARAQPGASHHRRSAGRRASALGSRRPARRLLIAAIRRRRSGAAGAERREGGPLFANGESGLALSWTRDRQYILFRATSAQDGRGPRGRGDWRRAARGGRGAVAVTTKRKDSSRRTASGWHSSPTRAAARKCSSSRSPKGGRTQVSTAGGAQVRWSGDGKEIFYVAPDGKMMAVVDRLRRRRRRT